MTRRTAVSLAVRLPWVLLSSLGLRFLRWWDSLRYNNVTIAEKFRRQGAIIGKGCYFQIKQLAAEPYLVEIGDNVSIAMGVMLVTHDGASVVFRKEYPSLRYYGRITIEDDCFIGDGAIITAGVTVGHGSIVGARSLVINDVKPGSVMLGNPAFRISSVEKYREKCLSMWQAQKLDAIESEFRGMDKFQVQDMMMSLRYRKSLREHLVSVLPSARVDHE